MEQDLDIGARIAVARKRRRLTQAALAGLVGRSEDWLSKIERGVHPIDRLSVIIQIARVLNIRDFQTLIGPGFVGITPDDGPEHDAVPGLRRALHTPPSMHVAEAVDLAVLTADITEAWQVYNHQTARYAVLGPMLPQLVAEAYQTMHAAADENRAAALRQCVSLLHLVQIYLRRVGELHLSEVAADRALSLADQLGDPALTSAAAWNTCCVLTSSGFVEESLDLARSTIDHYPAGPDATTDHLAAYGALHLQAVIAAVRAGQASTAWDLWRAAEEIADRPGLPQVDNTWHTSFGKTNVLMHRVHLAAEEGEPSEALHYADAVEDDPALPLERRTRYLIEVMHASRLQGDTMGTLYTAQKIQQLSPEEMRWHPLVRAAVANLLKKERPTTRGDIRALAEHVGVMS